MKKQPAPPAPPQCPQCTTPMLCGSPSWKEKRGPHCFGKPAGPDECACVDECGDDAWVQDGRARGCSKFFFQNPDCKPQPIYLAVYVTTDLVVGPFTPLPYDWE